MPIEEISGGESLSSKALKADNSSFKKNEKADTSKKEDKDEFLPSGVPLIKNLPKIGPFAAINQIFSQVMSFYAQAVTNPSPMFRLALHDWAVGMLASGITMLENLLQDATIKNTPEEQMAISLKSKLNGVLVMIKGMLEEQITLLKSDKELRKMFNDVSKSA